MYQAQLTPDSDETTHDVCIYCGNFEYEELIQQYCYQVMDEYAADYPNDAPIAWYKWKYEAIELLLEKESSIRISCHFCKK
jgi:hypothetical protein